MELDLFTTLYTISCRGSSLRSLIPGRRRSTVCLGIGRIWTCTHSAISDHAQGPATPIAVPLPDVPSGTASLESFMDYSSPESMHSGAQEAAASAGPTSPSEHRSTASESGKPEPSCVQTIRRALRRRKFKDTTVERITNPRRASTWKVYNARCNVLQRWCRSQRLNSEDFVSRTLPVG